MPCSAARAEQRHERPRPRRRRRRSTRRVESQPAARREIRVPASVIRIAPRRAARAGRARRRRSSAQLRERSTSRARLRRWMRDDEPRPTTTSDAATAITASAKIWPAPLPALRANAISARFAPFSISSSESSTISGLRRTSTPSAPIAEEERRRRRGTRRRSGPASQRAAPRLDAPLPPRVLRRG